MPWNCYFDLHGIYVEDAINASESGVLSLFWVGNPPSGCSEIVSPNLVSLGEKYDIFRFPSIPVHPKPFFSIADWRQNCSERIAFVSNLPLLGTSYKLSGRLILFLIPFALKSNFASKYLTTCSSRMVIQRFGWVVNSHAPFCSDTTHATLTGRFRWWLIANSSAKPPWNRLIYWK